MKTAPNNTKYKDLRGLKHEMEFLDFITWIATPSVLRSPKTQQELSKTFGVGSDTLSVWKSRPGFWTSVKEKRRQWGQERTPDVVMALYNRIIKTGAAPEVKLWFQYFEDWFERMIAIEPPLRRYQELSNSELMALKKKLQAKFSKKL